jgi:Tetracyclin repressor-like, C-terminal domain
MSSERVPGDLTERLLRRFLLLCESPRTQRWALALAQGSAGNARAGRRFYALANRMVLNPVARSMGVETSAIRLELVGSQLIGIAMLRYVLKIEPVASLGVDELVSLMAPAVREALAGGEREPALEVCSCQRRDLATVPW